MNTSTLEAEFRQGFGWYWNQGTLQQFLAFIDERCVIIDDDVPFPMDKAQFSDHLQFRRSHWESVSWIPYDTLFEVAGDTGIVSTAFTLRGKPKGSGFRLRHGLATVICHHDSATGGWRTVGITMDPIQGHIEGASPA